uniref:Uncharacterized protein n=1 Tax=Anopheles dirus TaxID=7168 RepID=A0A182N021_9DIPT
MITMMPDDCSPWCGPWTRCRTLQLKVAPTGGSSTKAKASSPRDDPRRAGCRNRGACGGGPETGDSIFDALNVSSGATERNRTESSGAGEVAMHPRNIRTLRTKRTE